MPITTPTPPPGFEQAVRAAVQSPATAMVHRFASLGGADPTVTPHAAHRVYTLGLADAAAGRGVAAAVPTGWRTFLAAGSRPVAIAEVADAAGGGVAATAALSEGEMADAAVRAVAAAEQDPRAGGDYELRLLQVPAIYTYAIWLHGRDDWFVPIRGTGLVAGRAYASDAFLTAVAAAAAKMLQRSGPEGAARI